MLSGRANMASVRDTMGCIRIPHADKKTLSPCKCSVSRSGFCCKKNYCPCRKNGFFCGDACTCQRSMGTCSNSIVLEQQGEDEVLAIEAPSPCKKQRCESCKTSEEIIQCMTPETKAVTDSLIEDMDIGLIQFDLLGTL